MEDFSQEFPVLKECTFLNHAAVSPLPARAARSLAHFAEEAARQAGGAWPRWAERLKMARREAAKLLGLADENEIGMVHNTTHGLLCIANSLPWRPGDNIVIAQHEFPANVQAWRPLRARGVTVRAVAERPDHTFDPADFDAAIDRRTRLVSVSLVQYATGYRMPVEALAALCHRRGVWFGLDAIQAVGAMPTRPAELDCDFLTADAHKWMLGPEGIGVLWVRPSMIETMNESMTGWVGRVRPWDYDDMDQPLLPTARRFEEGSYNMAGAAALSQSLGLLNEVGIDRIWSAIESLTETLTEGALQRGFTVVSPRGAGERSGIVALTHPQLDAEAAMRALLIRGVHVAARRGWLRVAPHFYNTPDQLTILLEGLAECIHP